MNKFLDYTIADWIYTHEAAVYGAHTRVLGVLCPEYRFGRYFENAGVKTVRDLVTRFNRTRLLKLQNMGVKVVAEIERWMAEDGLSFAHPGLPGYISISGDDAGLIVEQLNARREQLHREAAENDCTPSPDIQICANLVMLLEG